MSAAQTVLLEKPRQASKPWIGAHAWALISQRETLLKDNPAADRAELDQQIQRGARWDRREWLLEGTGVQDEPRERSRDSFDLSPPRDEEVAEASGLLRGGRHREWASCRSSCCRC